MEHKIGEIFKLGGEWYQCVEDSSNRCVNCCFFNGGHKKCSDELGECSEECRSDKTSAIFKKLEKVGEPYEHYGKLYQCYKIPMETEIRLLPNNCYPVGKDNLVEIEIKQKEEDMEEKEQCGDNRFEVIEKAKKHLLSSTNIESSKEEMKVLDNFLIRCWQMGWLDKYNDTKHSNYEKVGKNLRPFDLQKAREGKPVCTRDGRKARIICFDRVGDFSIVALTDDRDYKEEGINLYDINGKGSNECFDLMMLPEKKEGWVNVYKDGLLGTRVHNTKKEAFDNASPKDYVATVKIEWVATDANGQETIFEFEPERKQDLFWVEYIGDFLYLPKGSIKKLIGKDLTWEDEPVELKEE